MTCSIRPATNLRAVGDPFRLVTGSHDDRQAHEDARTRLSRRAACSYAPREFAEQVVRFLELMEAASDKRPRHDRYRLRTGLTCAPEFRGTKGTGRVEDAITGWLAEYFANAESQVRDLVPGQRPDMVLAYKQDQRGRDVTVVVEAKPVWQRWITTGERIYADVRTDASGRSTGPYLRKNLGQLVCDRDKLLREYSDPRDRRVLLALVFQREDEVDQQVLDAVGPGWEHHRAHIRDLCSSPEENIGMTAVVFWPRSDTSPIA